MIDLSVEQKESIFQNLVFVARKDGKLDVREIILLHKIAETIGMTIDRADKLIEEIGKEDFFIPEQPNEKLLHVINCVKIMVADKMLYQEEFHLVANIANKLGFKEVIIAICLRILKLNLSMQETSVKVLEEYTKEHS